MEKNIIIRNVRNDDLMQIADIGVRGWQMAYRGIIDDEYLDNMSVEERYQRLKNNYHENQFTVAELNGKIVGFCRYTLNNSSNDKNADGEITVLYVEPELKHNGIGTLIFKYVINEFKKNKNHRIILGCLKENYPSRKFYEKMGGKIVGEHQIEIGGKKYQEVGFGYYIA